jgi:hypothetical protein
MERRKVIHAVLEISHIRKSLSSLPPVSRSQQAPTAGHGWSTNQSMEAMGGWMPDEEGWYHDEKKHDGGGRIANR